MKEQLINDVLLRMQEVINREQLRVLEQVLLAVMYSVEVVRMETALSTDLDDNQYMLDSIKLNMQKRDLSEKTIEQYMRAARMFLDVVHKTCAMWRRRTLSIILMSFLVAGLRPIARRVSTTSDSIYHPYSPGCAGAILSVRILWKTSRRGRCRASR